jgi:hypothetical protein
LRVRILAILAACGLVGGCAVLSQAKSVSPQGPPTDGYRICLSLAPICTATNVLYKPGAMNLFTQESEFHQGVFVGFISWSHWGAASARGVGVATIDNCKPSCEDGTTSNDPAVIVAADPKPWHGEMVYSRVTATVAAIGWHEVYDQGLLPSSQSQL